MLVLLLAASSSLHGGAASSVNVSGIELSYTCSDSSGPTKCMMIKGGHTNISTAEFGTSACLPVGSDVANDIIMLRWVENIYAIVHWKVKSILLDDDGKAHITLDYWDQNSEHPPPDTSNIHFVLGKGECADDTRGGWLDEHLHICFTRQIFTSC